MSTLEVKAIAAPSGFKLAMPAGHILQVVSAENATSVSTTSTSYVTTGLTANITPSSTASKILIQVSGCLDNNANGRQGFIAFYRDSTNLSGGGSNAHGSLYTNNTRALSNLSAQHLDSPSTTSAITYSVRFKCPDGGEVEWNTQGVISNITLMEVAG